MGSRAFEPVLGDAHNEIRWSQLVALGTRPLEGQSRHNGYRRAVTPEEPENRPAAPYSRYGAPAPLAAAAALTAVQGLVTTLLGIAEMFSVAGDRVVMGVTTALFFVAYGVGLV